MSRNMHLQADSPGAEVYVYQSEGEVLVCLSVETGDEDHWAIVQLMPDEARQVAENLTDIARRADEAAGEYGT